MRPSDHDNNANDLRVVYEANDAHHIPPPYYDSAEGWVKPGAVRVTHATAVGWRTGGAKENARLDDILADEIGCPPPPPPPTISLGEFVVRL